MKQIENTKYYIEEDGRVYSTISNKYLKPYKIKSGYSVINLGRHRKELVHRLVAMVYIDNPDNLKEVNHIDGNKDNNHVSNLEWCTRQQNCIHAIKLGLNKPSQGSAHCHALLDENKVTEIRKLHRTKKYSCREIGEMFGVAGSTIDYIVNYRAWKHVK